MTTFMYTTTSDTVTVIDEAAVESVIDDYYFTVEPTLENSQLSFFADAKPNSAFDVYESVDQRNSVVEEFLTRIAPYIESEFKVKCVEVEGTGSPAAWSWTVTPDGEVSYINI